MEIKVRDLGEMESKSTQEIEKQLLEKHEAQQESLEKTSTNEEVQRVNLQEETQEVDELLEKVIPTTQYHKNDLDEITAGFEEIPVFEPVSKAIDEKKSLNDKLKTGGLAIGLNDKLAFIKHLFDGKSEDYDRVLSQINTSSDFEEAKNLIKNSVKPDYNNWKGKEEYEERFIEIVESKYA